jgi:hypothetical protein
VRAALLAAGLLLVDEPAQSPSDAFTRADLATVRLDPDALTTLPGRVRTELKRRGCTIPQTEHTSTRNVVRGRFTNPARTDWAVLCSRLRISTILVFRGGSTTHVDELGTEPDAMYLQTIDGKGTIGYSRSLTVATPATIRARGQDDSEPRPALSHDGIEDAFEGKASLIWYWHDGKWLRLAGAD